MPDYKHKIKEIITNSGATRISPILISRKIPEISKDDILTILFELAEEDFLKVNYEITCPECSADVKIIDSLNDIPNEIECDVCGYEFEPEQSHIWIFITPKKNPKKKINNEAPNKTDLSLDNVLENDSFQKNIADTDFFQPNRSKLKKYYKKFNEENFNNQKKILQKIVIEIFSSISFCEFLDLNNPYLILENKSNWNSILNEMGTHILINPCFKKNIEVSDIEYFGGDIKNKHFKSGILVLISEVEPKHMDKIKKKLHFFLNEGITIYIFTPKDINNIVEGKNLLNLLRDKKLELHFFNNQKSTSEKLYDLLFHTIPQIPGIIIVISGALLTGFLSIISGQLYLYILLTIFISILCLYAISYILTHYSGKKKNIMIIGAIILLLIFIGAMPYSQGVRSWIQDIFQFPINLS